MDLQKKAIEHSLKQLMDRDYHRVYSDVKDVLNSLEIKEDNQRVILAAMSESHQIHIHDKVNEAEKWLSVLLKDLNQKAK